MIETRLLKYFLAVAREQSITRTMARNSRAVKEM